MSIISSSTHGRAVEGVQRKIFGDTYKSYPKQYPEIFTKVTSTQAYERYLSLSMFGTAQLKPENESITFDTTAENWEQQLRNQVWALGYTVSEELIDDNNQMLMQKMPRALARSMHITKELNAASILNNAFTSGTGGDGSYLCATDHPLKNGGTLSNTLSTPADLSETSLNDAYVAIQAWTDDRGLKMHLTPTAVVVAPNGYWDARKLLFSTQEPGTANNDENPIKADFKKLIKYQYLTDPDAWFILTDCPDGMIHQMRKALRFGRDGVFDNNQYKFKADERYVFGWGDFRGIYGSAGA